MSIWRTLHPRRILHAPGAISVHGGPGEPRTQALRSGAEDSTYWATVAQKLSNEATILGFYATHIYVQNYVGAPQNLENKLQNSLKMS